MTRSLAISSTYLIHGEEHVKNNKLHSNETKLVASECREVMTSPSSDFVQGCVYQYHSLPYETELLKLCGRRGLMPLKSMR